ncbi:hypothetical protein [Citrobacter freundii]|uniref:hypothetical protein n=1 Tax=Citrobacter freundii TaxID=546 RepID=UPI000E1DCE4C|nr:hypothetical protein [Citrobacter freundii]MBJ9635548.1 hypothetical protein [Citrobacter freundii]RDU15069.1 hypothetical protein DWV02_23175 [Citrobacter freundii]
MKNNLYFAAFNVSLSVIMTALLIGITSRSAGIDDFPAFLILLAADLLTTFTAALLILYILTHDKQNP